MPVCINEAMTRQLPTLLADEGQQAKLVKPFTFLALASIPGSLLGAAARGGKDFAERPVLSEEDLYGHEAGS